MFFGCWDKYYYPDETIDFENEKNRKITYKAYWCDKSKSFTEKMNYYLDETGTEYFTQYYNWNDQKTIVIRNYMFGHNVEGEEFAGWLFSKSSSKPDYVPMQRVDTFNVLNNLYPAWSKDISITLEANNGSGEKITKIVKSYKPFRLSGDDFSNGDKKLMSYSKFSDSQYSISNSNLYYFNEDQYFTKDTTLYAVWSSPVTITFNANDGTDNSYELKTYQNEPEKCPVEFTREGYTFLGWSDKTKGPAKWKVKNDSAELISDSKDKQVYAVWSKPITVKLYSNIEGFSPEYTEIEVQTNVNYKMPNTSYVSALANDVFKTWNKNGDEVKGWKLNNSDGTSEFVEYEQYRAETISIYENTVSLVPVW